MITYTEVRAQSQQVWKQFGESKWKPTARKNAELKRGEVEDLRNIGIGKVLVSVALGASLERNLPALRKYQDRVDIICCDKAFKVLMDNGIKPKWVMMADTNILTKWMGGDDSDLWEKTKDVSLIATPYANYEWTSRWKGPRYFYVNKDAIRSEVVFREIMGKNLRVIPASSNVSNAQIVFTHGQDETSNLSFMGYEKTLLVGYDYCWKVDGNYYAENDVKPKRYYMAHHTLMDFNRDFVRTSQNLLFSARWLYTYITAHDLPIINCSGEGILDIPKKSDFSKQLGMVNNDPVQLKKLHDDFEALKKANAAFEKAKKDFLNSKEEMKNGRW